MQFILKYDFYDICLRFSDGNDNEIWMVGSQIFVAYSDLVDKNSNEIWHSGYLLHIFFI